MNSTFNDQKTDNICPFLGIPGDWQTAMDYPSLQNYCRITKPLAAPVEYHQREFCLVANYTQCNLFIADSTKSEPPIPPVNVDPTSPQKSRPVLVWLTLGLVLVIAIALTLWQVLSRVLPVISSSSMKPLPSDTVHTNIMVKTSTPFMATLEPVEMVAPQFTPTDKLTETPTATAEPPHLLRTPFGSEQLFQLHQVTSGEDLISIANSYHTSVEAIRAANYNMPQELWVDTVIIIPLNQTDATVITPMTAYEITSAGISVETIALEQAIDLDELIKINGRPAAYQFQIGEWVILPHTPSTS